MCAIFSVCITVALKITPLISPPVLTAISIMALIVLLIIPIGGLLVFHLVLISKGRTTNEHVTGKYRGQNFFTRNCLLNFMHLFFGSLIPQYKAVKLKKRKNTTKKRGEPTKAEHEHDESSAASSCSEDNSKKTNGSIKRRGSESDSDHSNRGSLSDASETNQLKSNQSSHLNPNNSVNEKKVPQEELLDVVLKNKKALRNNRKTSNASSSSVSASMLNNKDKKSTKLLQLVSSRVL